MSAKPVIDMLAVVQSLAALDDATPQIERLGYGAMGEFGTTFTRGRTNATLFPKAEALHGDRNAVLGPLRGRHDA
jgi:GrpB-like predicted nucleotidyltransferase (UPF0157 family)